MATVTPDLLPLDYAILALLPAQGEMFNHAHLGMTIKAVGRRLGDVTPAQLNGRIRTLKLLGLVVDVTVQPVSDGKGWQITPAGRAALEAHEDEEA